jgi:hypothetical protein
MRIFFQKFCPATGGDSQEYCEPMPLRVFASSDSQNLTIHQHKTHLMKKIHAIPPLLAIGALLSLQAPTQAAVLGFSVSSNPNAVAGGTERFGYSSTLGGAFVQDTFSGTNASGIQEWNAAGPLGSNPAVRYNPSASAITVSATVYDPLTLDLHPGAAGEYAIIRFTPSTTGVCTFNGSFWGQDGVGTTTDVHVLKNGVALFNDNVNGFGTSSTRPFFLSLPVTAGDNFDFAVGRGSNNTFFNDSTGFTVNITHVPEPATTSLSLGVVSLLARRRRAR